MKKIAKLGGCSEGGSCAICNADYNALSGNRYLLERFEGDDDTPIVEPFNLCEKCSKRVEKNGMISKQYF